MSRLLLLWSLLVCALDTTAVESLTHGRFSRFALYAPAGSVQQFVILLSDADGWTPAMDRMALQMRDAGALVAGIDTAALLTALDDGGECVNAVGDFENLAHFVQGYAHVRGYFAPVLAGVGAGGALAYVTLAQAGTAIFSGLLTTDFCPTLALREQLCKRDDDASVAQRNGKGQTLLPASLGAPWRLLTRPQTACPAAEMQTRLAAAPQARATALPAGEDDAWPTQWGAPLVANLHALAPAVPNAAQLPHALEDLPLVEVKARSPGTRFAVFLSGDGGWAGLDKSVADALAEHGLPVVGFDSLRYFWSARTPAGFAADLDRLVRYYAARWKATAVILIGFSQGADVLPFALNRLPPASRRMVTQLVLLSPGQRASFEFHLDNWIHRDDDGLPLAPEIARLAANETLCVYGKDDEDAICPRLQPFQASLVALPGDHHFDGDYEALAARILARLDQPEEPAAAGRPSLRQ